MGKIEIFEVKKLKQIRWVGPHYYDYPDGEDLPGKLAFATTVSGALGLLIGGAYSHGLIDPAKTLKTKLFRTAQCVVPCVGVAMSFTFATYFATRIRGKDDEYNYAIGGFFSGLALAGLSPLRNVAIVATCILPVVGYYEKYCQLHEKDDTKKVKYGYWPSYYLKTLNYSTVEERPGNWTRDPIPE